MDGKQQGSLRMGFTKIGILTLTPVFLSLLFLIPSIFVPAGSNPVTFLNQLSCLYVLLLVGIYWMSNTLPIAVTAIIPIVSYPLLGICKSADASMHYMSDFNMTAACAVIIMLSFDSCGLRKRLSLKILRHTSCSFRWIYLDVYLATGMLSIWIHSAAATFLMIKVVDDIIACLKEGISYGTIGEEREVLFQEISQFNTAAEVVANVDKSPEEIDGQQQPVLDLESSEEGARLPGEHEDTVSKHRSTSNMPKVSTSFTSPEDIKKYHEKNDEMLNEFGGELLYVVAVAANICSIIWPHTSPMGAEMFKRSYVMPFDPQRINQYNGSFVTGIPFGISSANLIVYSLPLVLMNSAIAIGVLFWITFMCPRSIYKLLGFKGDHLARVCPTKEAKAKFSEAIEEKSKEIELWQFSEDVAMLSTIFMIDLVIFRLPVMMEGWAEKFPKIDTGFSVSFAMVVLVLYIAPKRGCKIFKWATAPNDKPTHAGIVPWKTVQSEFPWSVMLFIGGSTTLGKYTDKALGSFIAKNVLKMAGSSHRACQIIMVFVMQLLVLFMSNPGASVATTKIWYRIMKEGITKHVLPTSALSLILPVMTMGSLAFVSPIQSVPSVMVYELAKNKKLSAWYYLKIGIPLFICTLLPTLGYLILWKTTDLMFM